MPFVLLSLARLALSTHCCSNRYMQIKRVLLSTLVQFLVLTPSVLTAQSDVPNGSMQIEAPSTIDSTSVTENIKIKEQQTKESSDAEASVEKSNPELPATSIKNAKPSIKKRSSRKKRKKYSKQQIESYFKRAIESGSISIEDLDRLEKKYLVSEQRFIPHVNAHPYMPHRWDYGLEVGSMWVKQEQYWLGGNLGHNIGTCVFSKYPGCQQYLDILLGTSGRDGVSNYYGVLSLRWQFIEFPKTYSALARVFAGVMNGISDDESKRYPVYGIGIGLSSYLHPRSDIRWELRYGNAGALGNFTQLFVSVELKVSRWVEFFADKLGKAGKGTRSVIKTGVESTEGVLKQGVDSTKSVIKKGVDSIRSED